MAKSVPGVPCAGIFFRPPRIVKSDLQRSSGVARFGKEGKEAIIAEMGLSDSLPCVAE
jgi:hypothetical protein